ncbi:hypothetical protein [Natronorarus salvus]|uniref:hypothetical protein n=1 Tax=Natronorarus salvus TaxID=3117733 RepID=UPI002F26C806
MTVITLYQFLLGLFPEYGDDHAGASVVCATSEHVVDETGTDGKAKSQDDCYLNSVCEGRIMNLSPVAITSLLTSLFPSTMIDDLARESEVVVRERKPAVRILVWTVIVDLAVGGEARSIAPYRRTYNGATGQNLVTSSFYD